MKTPRSVRRWWGAVLAAAAIAGCTSAPDPAASPAPSSASTSRPTPVAWAPCGSGLECGTLTVPVDRARAGGATTPVALVRHRATDRSRRIGVLMVNPGGPGASAVDFVRQAVTAAAPGAAPYLGREVLARYDVVGMDPRGVGGSHPVACLSDAEREKALARDLDPRLPGGLPLPFLDRQNARDARACLAGNDRTYLAHLATDDVARDMDAGREALGEQKIAYLGLSYGTLLGVTYAQLFPGRLSRWVLDAPVHPTRWQGDPVGIVEDQTVSAERQLDLYLDTCRAQRAACGFGGGDPAAAFDALVRRLERTPLTVPATPPLPRTRVDGASVLLAARTAVFSAQLWPTLTAALITAQRGDGRTVAALNALLTRDPDGTPSALGEANAAVNCLDMARPDRRALTAQVPRLERLAPRFGAVSSYALLSCSTWPVANPDRYTGPYTGAGTPPALVIGGRLDSQTPYPWARAMTETLTGAVLLTRTGVGHGSYGSRLNGPCIDDAVDTYLTTGTLPRTGAVCTQPPPTTAPPTAP